MHIRYIEFKIFIKATIKKVIFYSYHKYNDYINKRGGQDMSKISEEVKAKTINIVSKTQKIKKVVIEVFYFIW